jgi:hypothetical protein
MTTFLGESARTRLSLGIYRYQDSIFDKRVNLFHEDGVGLLSVIDNFL